MKVRVKTPFRYAHDGMHSKPLKAGDQIDVHDNLVPGLVRDARG